MTDKTQQASGSAVPGQPATQAQQIANAVGPALQAIAALLPPPYNEVLTIMASLEPSIVTLLQKGVLQPGVQDQAAIIAQLEALRQEAWPDINFDTPDQAAGAPGGTTGTTS
jgi:hypothetical protein